MFQLALLAFEQSMNVKMITYYVKSLELLVIVTEFPPQPFDKPLKRKTIINDINCADTNLLKSFRNQFKWTTRCKLTQCFLFFKSKSG